MRGFPFEGLGGTLLSAVWLTEEVLPPAAG